MRYRPNGKPVLLLDQDGPLAEWNARFWDIVETFEMDAGGLDRHTQEAYYATDHLGERDAKIMSWIADNSYWYDLLPVTEGAQDGVAELEKHFDVWICTKPSPDNRGCYQGKADWIARHFPSLMKKTNMCINKAMMMGDILLDDAPRIEWIADAVWTPVIFSCPFNGEGSEWENLTHWKWGDDIEILLDLVR